jgi:exodeoxyribonuclease III
MVTKLLSWNVNGLRSVGNKGFGDWFKDQSADVVCVQEIKVQKHQLPPELLNPYSTEGGSKISYHSFLHSAEKPGYSGVAIFSRKEPLDVREGIGDPQFDREGRVLLAEFSNYQIISAYFPNSQRDHARLDFKLAFCDAFLKFAEKERKKGKSLIICGDLNIAHTEIDVKNAKANMKNAGFLPQEREWLTKFLAKGYLDSFRHFTKDPDHFTWWSNRPGVRARNIGWRLDYFLTDADSKSRLKASKHQHLVLGSDHCPVSLEIKT